MTAAVDAWREPFERALDADPSDQRVRRDLADHLDELSDPDAEAVRWLADNDRRPEPPTRQTSIISKSWNWWPRGDPFKSRRHCVPFDLGFTAENTFAADHGVYPTRRAAEADFCRAFRAARAAGWRPD